MRNRVVATPAQRFSVVAPKRGTQRLIQKKPAAKKYANYKKVPYTRTGWPSRSAQRAVEIKEIIAGNPSSIE